MPVRVLSGHLRVFAAEMKLPAWHNPSLFYSTRDDVFRPVV